MVRSPSLAFRQLGRDILNFWQVLRYNLPLRLLFIALIVSSIAGSMFDKLAIYWYKYDFKDISVMALTAPFALVVFLVSIPIWTLVSRITSKRTVWLMGSLIGMSFYTTFYLLNPRDVNVIIALSMLGAAGGAAGYVMFWAMLPDTVEYNEWKLGDRAEARIFGFAGMAQKSALAVNAIIVGVAFELIGFVPGREQTPATLHAMLAVMCLVPVAGTIVTVLTMWRYPLNASFHREIVEDIRARAESAPKADDNYFTP
jgi:GPH family glycoside/pentoside/hexuronide:cation symporter